MPDLPEMNSAMSAVKLFGSELRRYRNEDNKSLEALGTACNYTGAFVGLVEQGKRTPPRDLAEKADKDLGARGALITLWMLANAAPHPDWFRPFVEHEARATTLHVYEPQVITGLLQTEAYAYEVLRARRPEATPDEVQHDVAARLQRQEILRRESPPRLWVVLDEAALRRVIGSPAAMRTALAHLLSAADSPRTTIQVLPFSAGAHAALNGGLTLLGKHPEAAYCEGHAAARLVTDPDEHAECEHAFELLQSAALPVPASLDLIRDVMEGYGS